MTFHAMGDFGRGVDRIAIGLTVVSVAFLAVVLGMQLWFGWRYRAGSRADRSNRPSSSWKAETVAALSILAFGAASFAWAGRLYLRGFAAPAGAVDVYVLGKRWMWTFSYPGGPAEVGLLEVPRGRAVRLLLASEDVIHSFYVPQLRLKQDAVPGRYTSLTFTPDEEGDFLVLCTEFCGTDHSGMRATLRVVSPEEWERNRREPARTRADGERAYRRLGCASCHDAGGRIAPPLAGLYGTYVRTAGGGTLFADEQYLRASILDPNAAVTAGYRALMPTYRGQLGEAELAALVEYLKRGKEHAP
jgi:cytochrome c oxidase subunit 2